MFIPTLPKQFCAVNIKCADTYLRFLPGQTADVSHPDITEVSIRLAFASQLPPPFCTWEHVGHVQTSPCGYGAHVSTFCIFGGLDFSLVSVSAPVSSSPRTFDLNAVFHSAICWKSRLFCWAGREVHTYHAIHVTVMQLKKCLRNAQCGTSLKGHILSTFTWHMQIIEANVIFYNQLKTRRPKMTSNPHAQFNTVKLYLTKKNKNKTDRLLITDSSLYLKFMQFLPLKKK